MPGGRFDGYDGLSRSVSEGPDKGTKGRRELAAAWIVEMVSLKGRASILEDLLEPAALNVGPDEVPWRIGQTHAIEGRIYRRSDAIL